MIYKRVSIIWPMVFIAIVFGILTIKSGGAVLFTNGEARIAAGNYVAFVLWFNFLAGFAYVIAGVGLWLDKSWAIKLAIGIAASTLIVFAAFAVHILLNGNYEMRTVAAMTLRSVIWSAIAIASYTYNKQSIMKASSDNN